MKPGLNKVIAKPNEYLAAISVAKDKHIKQMWEKMNNPPTAPKTYWKILILLLKVPAMPPLLVNEEI